jgi:RNA recognition motif-containing protein
LYFLQSSFYLKQEDSKYILPFFMSSRLFIRNIPKHITEERLKKHFSQKGAVTDVKILKKK